MEIRVSVTKYVHDRIIALRNIQSSYSDDALPLPTNGDTEINAEYLSKTYGNSHPDVVAYIDNLRVQERLARRAAAKTAKLALKASSAAPTPIDSPDDSPAPGPELEDADMDNNNDPSKTVSPAPTAGPAQTAEEEEENSAESRENEKALRGPVEGGYRNASVIRANAMKHLVNFFEKGQVSSLSV